MTGLTASLLARRKFEAPVALVVAHPDDETLAVGGLMPLLPDLLVVHLTDGAPRDGADARALGFDGAPAYAAARRRELAAALSAGGVAPRLAECGVADQDAVHQLPFLIDRLTTLLAGAAVVITHPYEGGHPDHDAAALAVRRAVDRLPAPPAVFEFPSYHAGPQGWVTGTFLPGPAATRIALTEPEQLRKQAMLACFATQQAVLRSFSTDAEALRPAPHYNFAAPPHGGVLLYEGFGWTLDGRAWRHAAAAMADLA
jgi:LmbE family N-acetylglucosaminyl deacetylase